MNPDGEQEATYMIQPGNPQNCPHRYFELNGELFVYDEGYLRIFRVRSKRWIEVSMSEALIIDLARGRRISKDEADWMAARL